MEMDSKQEEEPKPTSTKTADSQKNLLKSKDGKHINKVTQKKCGSSKNLEDKGSLKSDQQIIKEGTTTSKRKTKSRSKRAISLRKRRKLALKRQNRCNISC